MGVCVPEPRVCHGYKGMAMLKNAPFTCCFLPMVRSSPHSPESKPHESNKLGKFTATYTPSSEPRTASGSQRRELARTTLSFQRCRCSFDAQQPTSSFLRPLVPEPSSSPQHGHLLLHLLFARSLSLRQTCQQSSQPGAGSICQ